jgi:hypothetical protein
VVYVDSLPVKYQRLAADRRAGSVGVDARKRTNHARLPKSLVHNAHSGAI